MNDCAPQFSIRDSQGASAGWAASLLFWLCLLSAAGLYAVAALTPKLQTHLELKQRYYENQVQLVAMEQQTQSLKRVMEALQTDPEFVTELARVEFRSSSSEGEERVPVDPGLNFHGILRPHSSPALSEESSPRQRPAVWYAPLLEAVVLRREVRVSLLASAVLLVLLAFTIFREPRSDWDPAALERGGTIWTWLARRYRRPVDDNQP